MKLLLFFILISLNTTGQLPNGNWHGSIKLNDTLDLPFTFSTQDNKIEIQNGEEKINVDEVVINKDSVIIRMPVFDSEFRCKFSQDEMTGLFYNHARKANNVFSFHAERGLSYRFSDRPEKALTNITGRYHAVFAGEDDESKNSVGIFSQSGSRVTATFLTTTGDYRYLEGELNGKRLWLSCFDGFHLFLFTAIVKGDSLLNGEYFSGSHWHDTWLAWKDADAKLLPADSLTKVKAGFKTFDFSFPDENGKIVSISEEQFKNKTVIVQLMGTWCPNCMDETKFLSEWYNMNKNNNIKIVALDYERITDTTIVSNNIRRLKKRFEINYPILFAGSSDKKQAALTLPMLDKVFAFPTTIFLDKEKRVVKIHTGFSGPATGTEYTRFIEWFDNVISELAKD